VSLKLSSNVNECKLLIIGLHAADLIHEASNAIADGITVDRLKVRRCRLTVSNSRWNRLDLSA
jgi:hypothetical protein